MDNQPVISVITIIRDNIDGLKRTVESVTSQQGVLLEHIVIDAASTDGSAEWLAEVVKEDRPYRFEFVSEPDSGRYDGMNKGAKLANGRLLWFLHAGDVFGGSTSAALVANKFLSTPFNWGYGMARKVDADGDVVDIYNAFPQKFARFALGGRPIPHQASFFEREFFWKMGGYSTDFGVAADQYFMLRCAAVSKPRLFAELLCNFDVTGIGSTRHIFHHYFDMIRGRRLAGVKVLKFSWLDATVTFMLACYAWLKSEAADIARKRSDF